jgi:hypothetical protein
VPSYFDVQNSFALSPPFAKTKSPKFCWVLNTPSVVTFNPVPTIMPPSFVDVAIGSVYGGENAHIDPPVALQTDHPKLLFFLRV